MEKSPKKKNSSPFTSISASRLSMIYRSMIKDFRNQIKIEIKKEKRINGRKYLNNLKRSLGGQNKKEIYLVQKRINKIDKILKKNFKIELILSGSVTKHTYVHGLSDIDILVNLREESPKSINPKMVQERIKNILKTDFKTENDLEAINILVDKKIKIQLVPVILKDKDIFFPSKGGKKWIKILPQRFSNQLKKRDDKLCKKLSTLIRIIKIINVEEIASKNRLKNHHIEVLAYLYSLKNPGEENILNWLHDFFLYAKDRVKEKVRDTSNQFTFVDNYLGKPKNKRRKEVSKNLEEVSNWLIKYD